jgi:hypothetical protein
MTKKSGNYHKLFYVMTFILLSGIAVFVLKTSFQPKPCANTKSCEDSLKLSVKNDEDGLFNGRDIKPPQINLANVADEPRVLGSQTSSGEKHIYVDLTNQTLKAYDGDTLFMEAKISSGKWYPTPTGDFIIWSKLRSTLMSGGEGADYYYLPNVPYVMYFYNSQVAQYRGFALHGTYWHDNFGHAMSHGCVNMRTIDAQKLYYWANPYTSENSSKTVKDGTGTKITIYGKAP